MSTTYEVIDKLIEHPMEQVLDIESGTTSVPAIKRVTDPLVEPEEYDDKDIEIEQQYQEVYDAAMGAFEGQCDEAELVEGKYKARNAEVAVQFLQAALTAAKEKGALKEHKDKHQVALNRLKGGPNNTTNNNLIVADRNDLLKAFMEEQPVVDEQ